MRRYHRRRFFRTIDPVFGFFIYGYEDDSPYEEDQPDIDRMIAQGFVFGCWFSVASIEGELGTNPRDELVEISEARFDLAQSLQWSEPL